MRLHITIITVIIFLSVTIIITNNVSNEEQDKIPNQEIEETLYTLKDYNGQIALFINDNITPTEMYNIFTKSLPEADAAALKEGVTAENEKELNRLLEEYLG